MNKLLLALVLPPFLSLATGCDADTTGEEADGDDAVGEAEGFFVVENSLIPNSLIPNSLIPNSLIPNALSPTALGPGALAALQAPTADGAAARQLIKYTVSCAFTEAQSFAFTWTDSSGQVHAEVYWGDLGIAPGWADNPLDGDLDQRLVSACLAARVNWYGTSVVISARSTKKPFKKKVDSFELTTYPHIEGAFWGNLFAPQPYLHACHEPANVAISRAASRDCAAGHLDESGQPVPCGIIALAGPCSDWCVSSTLPGGTYRHCVDRPGVPTSPSTTAVITTALP